MFGRLVTRPTLCGRRSPEQSHPRRKLSSSQVPSTCRAKQKCPPTEPDGGRYQRCAAIDTFEALGAHPWAERGRIELAATGQTLRRRDPATIDKLTPQELRIGLELAGGKTIREAAAALFLSPRTIDYHLRHVYQKLDIHSREELARTLSNQTSVPVRWSPGS